MVSDIVRLKARMLACDGPVLAKASIHSGVAR